MAGGPPRSFASCGTRSYTANKSLMYIDFDDQRPETPRVSQVISAREGVLLSLVVHLALLVAILLAPKAWFESKPMEVVAAQPEPLRYVQMLPAIDKSELAKRLAEQ